MPRGKKPSPEIAKRNQQMINLCKTGKTYEEVGKLFGVTGETVRQAVIKAGLKGRNFKIEKRNFLQMQMYLSGYNTREIKEKLNKRFTLGISAAQRKQHRTARFWRFVKKQDNTKCWLWLGYVDLAGYGRYRLNGKSDFAHRIAFELHYDIPVTDCILHSCDNPPCCNPFHLRQGTMTDNVRDRDERGRSAWQKDYQGWKQKQLRGRRNGKRGNAKLKDFEAKEVRARFLSGENANDLSREYKVCKSTIYRIGNGTAYTNI